MPGTDHKKKQAMSCIAIASESKQINLQRGEGEKMLQLLLLIYCAMAINLMILTQDKNQWACFILKIVLFEKTSQLQWFNPIQNALG